MVGLVRHSQRKRRETDRPDLRIPAPVFDSTRPRGGSSHEDKTCPHLLREPLAKRCGGALGRQLPTRPVRPHCRAEATLSEAIAVVVCSLLPRGPVASWTREGNAEGQNSFGSLRSGPFSGSIG